MKPEVKSLFDRACDTIGVTPETRDTRWRMLRDLSLTANDELLISLVASGRMEELVENFARSASSIDAMPEAVASAVRKAAQEAVGPVAKAATKQVEASHAALAASTGKEVAASASAYLDREFQRRRFTVSAIVAIAVLGLCLLVGYAGYGLGARTVVTKEARVAAIAARPDVQRVLNILAANPNLDASVATWCASGSGRSTYVEGAQNCSLPLWVNGKSAAPQDSLKGGTLVSIWTAGSNLLNQFAPLTIAFVFLVLGVLLRKILVGLGHVPGVKWLTT